MEYDIFLEPVLLVWETLSQGFLTLFFAIILFIIGVFVAKFVAKIIKKIIKKLKVDDLVLDIEIFEKAKESGFNIHPSAIIEFVVKWFIIISFLLIISEYLKLNAVSEFFYDIITFIPTLIIAIVLLLIGFIVGQFVKSITEKSLQNLDISKHAKKLLPAITEWSIIVFSIFAAMIHLNIGSQLIEIFFSGIIYAIALAFALAFGLGGKEQASKVIESFFSHKK